MDYKNTINKKIKILKILLLDIFPSFEDLEKQDKTSLSIIFYGIQKFFDLKELIKQKKEIIIRESSSEIKIRVSIIKSTDVLATGQMLIKQGKQWVTFLYENKESCYAKNLALNLIDCIKINIFCEFVNQNSDKKGNNSIELPEKNRLINKINKRQNENINKIVNINIHNKNNLNKKNHNVSKENFICFNINNAFTEKNTNATSKKILSNNLEKSNNKNINQILTRINKERNKKYHINNILNDSMYSIDKYYNNNNLSSLNSLSNNNNNRKLKKRIKNNSVMNISRADSKTLNYKNNFSCSKRKQKKDEQRDIFYNKHNIYINMNNSLSYEKKF